MKLAIIGSRGYPSTYGGFETFVRFLAPYLRDRGHSVTVYCRGTGALHRRRIRDNVTCITTLGIDTKVLSTLSHGLTSALDASVRRYDAALVLNVANGFYLPLLRGARIPAILNVDGIEWQRGKWSSVGQAVFRGGARAAARWAPTLIADSQAVASMWDSEFGVRPIFIPYGAEISARRAGDRITRLGLASDAYVLVVARLAPENNVKLTLDAVELLDDRPPLVVVGTANYASPLVARLNALADAGRVLWLGHVDDQELLTDLWAHCAVYVHGHSVGGTNPALLQALGAGAPTLVFPSAFNKEVVLDEEHLYEPTPEGLAAKLTNVLSDAVLREALRESGWRRVRESYRWPDVCSRYERELERAAGI